MEFGRYNLKTLIGEGGFGQVWKGTITGEMGFAKPVAIKVLHPGLAIDESKHASLIHEALLGARMKHPNIVDVYEFTKVDGRFLMVMELVNGRTLDELIKEHSGGVPVEMVRDIVIQIGKALAHVHGLKGDDGLPLGLVHRDLKPANVMVTADGVVKICDFGIALSRLVDRQTGTGMLRGTPNFMSPEHIRGHEITAAADVWALGAIAFEMLTGSPLVRGTDPKAVIMMIPAVVGGAAAAEVESKDLVLSELIGACLQQTPAYRPNSGEVVTMLVDGSRLSVPSGRGKAPNSNETFDSLSSGAFLGDETLSDNPSASPAVLEEKPADRWLVPLAALTGVPVFVGALVTVFDQPIEAFWMMGLWSYVLLVATVVAVGNLARLGMKIRNGEDPSPVAWLLGPMMLFVFSNLGTGLGLMMVNKALVNAPLAMRAALSGNGIHVALTVDLVGMVLGSMLCVFSLVEIALSYRTVCARHPLTPTHSSNRIGLGAAVVVVGGMIVWGLGWWLDRNSALAISTSAPALVFLTLFIASAAAGGMIYTGPQPEPAYRALPGAKLAAALLGLHAVCGVAATAMTYREWSVFQAVAVSSAEPKLGLQAIHRFEGLVSSHALWVAMMWFVLTVLVMAIVFGLRSLWQYFKSGRPVATVLVLALPWVVFCWALASKVEAAAAIQPSFLASAANAHLGLWVVDTEPEARQRGVRIVEGGWVGLSDEPATVERIAEWMASRGLTNTPLSGDGEGVAVGDVIIAVNSRPVTGVRDLVDLLESCGCAADQNPAACSLDACLIDGRPVELTLTRESDAAVEGGTRKARMITRDVNFWVNGPPENEPSAEPTLPTALERLTEALNQRESPMLIGMSPLEAVVTTDDQATALTLALFQQLEGLPNLRFLRMDTTPGAGDAGMWAQAAGVDGGVESIIVGSVGRLGSEAFLNLERLNVENGKVIGRSYRRATLGVDGLLPLLVDMLEELLDGTGVGASKEALMAVVRDRSSGNQECYEEALETQPDLETKLQIFIRLAPTGRVKDVRITPVDGRAASPVLVACLERKAQSWLFPVSINGLEMSINFVFGQ